MGLSTVGCAGFRLTWSERTPPKKPMRHFGHKLQVVGDYAVSVDGIIVPKLSSAEVYEGSQISLMRQETGTDKYVVLMILRAHFEQVEDKGVIGKDDAACWGSCLFRE